MLKKRIIRASASPWASPIVLVKQKGRKMRICIDYRKLNAAIIKDNYPLPRVDELLDCLMRRSPGAQERVDARQILGPEPVESVEAALIDSLCQTPVVHPRHAVRRRREQAPQCAVIQLGHDTIIEVRLVAAIEGGVGERGSA